MPVGDGCGRWVVVAETLIEHTVAVGDAAAERGRELVDAGIDHGDRTILAVVRHAQAAQVVQADNRAGAGTCEAEHALELPDTVVVGGVQGRAIGREADAQGRFDEAGRVLPGACIEVLGEVGDCAVRTDTNDPAALEVAGIRRVDASHRVEDGNDFAPAVRLRRRLCHWTGWAPGPWAWSAGGRQG